MLAWKRSSLPFGAIALFAAITFMMLSIRYETLDITALFIGVGIIVLLFIQYYVFPNIFGKIDQPLIICVNILAVIGLSVLYRLEPIIGIKQFMWFFVGLVAMIGTIIVVKKMVTPEKGLWFFIGGGLLMLLLALIFGNVVGGAQNWIRFEKIGINLQPSEFVKVALVFACAAVFREKRRYFAYMPAFIFAIVSIIILVFIKDLGAALLYSILIHYPHFFIFYNIYGHDVCGDRLFAFNHIWFRYVFWCSRRGI